MDEQQEPSAAHVQLVVTLPISRLDERLLNPQRKVQVLLLRVPVAVDVASERVPQRTAGLAYIRSRFARRI
jgi:hypothetical protein